MNSTTQPSSRSAARQAIDQANRDQSAAASRQASASQAVRPESASEFSRWLSNVSPQADQAASSIDKQLSPRCPSSNAHEQSRAMVRGRPGYLRGTIGNPSGAGSIGPTQREMIERDPMSGDAMVRPIGHRRNG